MRTMHPIVLDYLRELELMQETVLELVAVAENEYERQRLLDKSRSLSQESNCIMANCVLEQACRTPPFRR